MALEEFSVRKKKKYEEYMEILRKLREIERKTKLQLKNITFELTENGLRITWTGMQKTVTLTKEELERLIEYFRELGEEHG